MNNPQAKPKINLTSVTPEPPPAETGEMDTKTPIDVSVIPFSQIHIAKWGPWLLARLQQHFSMFAPLNYIGILSHHMGSNHSLFIRSRYAILLAVISREPFEPRPYVDLVFCFKHVPEKPEQDKDARLLFRRMDEWARSHGALEIRILHPERCDLSFSRSKESLGAEEARYLAKAIKESAK